MNILIAGSSGFIGQELCPFLRSKGHNVRLLVRRAAKDSSEIVWNPDKFEIPDNALESIDVVINLCGRNIADSLWTPKFKQELFESRVKPVRTLTGAINKAPNQKITFISVSGIGVYGSKIKDVDEESPSGNGFFSLLADNWEKEALSAQSPLHRVSVLRLGIVLGKNGGMVKKVAPFFKIGLGARIGQNDSWISWVSIEDVCRGIEYVIDNAELSGKFNLVNPNAYQAKDFYNELGKAFGNSVFLQAPNFLLSKILGEFAEETLLASQKVLPKRLLESGFIFKVNTPVEAVKTGS